MDLRYALRMLSRSPGFTAVAVLTLALGIGINTIVFTLYGAVALKPIAARAPRELVRVSGTRNGYRVELFSYAEYDRMRGQAQSFSDVIATSDPQTIIGRMPQAKGESEVFRARLVSGNYFSGLGVSPPLGRGLLPEDREAVVLSHEFWRTRFASNPSVLTQAIQVQGSALHIVGVAPARFAGTGVPPQMPDMWIPLAVQAQVLPVMDWQHDGSARFLQVLGRRKPGLPVEQASAELEVLAQRWPLVDGKPMHLAARSATFFQADGGEFATFMVICQVLLVAVGLILLIGSINLVNLLFARHSAREREFAVRLAMGAGRFHLVRQLCNESLLLGILGGAAGLLLSLWACEWIRLAIAGALQRLSGGIMAVHLDISPDWQVFGYTAAVSAITGLAIGLWPAVRASRGDVVSVLKQSSGGPAGARGKRGVLIGAQVAACLMLLAGAGLLFRGVWRSGSIDPGFDVKHVLVVGVPVRTAASTEAAQTALLRHAADRIRAIPGVAEVSWSERPPFLGHGSFDVRGEHGAWVNVLFNQVSDRYLATLGIPLVSGRNFTPEETEIGAPVIVISDVAARAIWPGQDPLGRTIPRDEWLKRFLPRESYTVIGVVKGVRSTYLSKPDVGFIYYPKPLAGAFGGFLVRTRSSRDSVSRAILAQLGAIHPDLPAQTFMAGLDEAPMQLQRMMAEAPAMVASALGALALLLASLGIFGLVSHMVTLRTREIAIRVSLGAQIRDVVRTVMGQTMRPVAIGAGIGLAGALGISALLAKLIVTVDAPDLTYGAGAFDPVTFCGSLAVLTAVIAVASIVPVRRATRIAPADALRNE